jgi:mannose-P-dolichol utilization defect protein 1
MTNILARIRETRFSGLQLFFVFLLLLHLPSAQCLQLPKASLAVPTSSRKETRFINLRMSTLLTDPSTKCERFIFKNGKEEKKLVNSNAGTSQQLAARSLGYVMAVGAMVIYTPILLKILKQNSATGFSVSTWIFNILGLSLSIAYPMKKGFPFSTYMELVGACCQSIGILGLLCFHHGKLPEYAVGMITLAISFSLFKKSPHVSQTYLNIMQVAASLIANYANIPQILLTFQTKKASWSWISAAMSLTGCLIRVFTTLQLTKDKLVLFGYLLGVITNSILLVQIFMFQ